MASSSKKNRFAGVVGSPGEKPRFVGFIRASWPFLVILFFGGYLVRAAFPFPPMGKMTIGILLLVLCGVFGGVIFWSERRLADYVKGARGEEVVARQLALLPSAYRVFHGLSLEGSHLSGSFDYDHIVVGPTGIFVVETKNWSGTITLEQGRILYNGHEPTRSPVEQAKSAASDLQRALSGVYGSQVTVQPVVCFAGGNFGQGVTGTAGVIICSLSSLRNAITDSVDSPIPGELQSGAVAFLEGKMA